MKVIPPITLNNTNIVSNASSTSDPTEWNTTLAYTVSTRVKVTVGNVNKIYECIIAATNLDDSPELDLVKITPKWVEIGSINKYAMFDILRNTQTIETTGTLTVTLTPGMSVDSLAILGLTNVLDLVITATSSGTPVYSKTYNLNERFTRSWYTYFFGYFRSKKAIVTFDLPSQYSNLIIIVTFTGVTTIGVGACVVGTSIDIGYLQNGASVDATNYSSINRDSYGNAFLIQRRSVPKTTQKLFIDKSKYAKVLATKDLLEATTAVWCGLDVDTETYFDALLILGFYRTFTFDLNNPIGVSINLELEEI